VACFQSNDVLVLEILLAMEIERQATESIAMQKIQIRSLHLRVNQVEVFLVAVP
jgi:hypothetical protein